ncbi:MAG: tryptophan synthase subunit alpha [Armatimonadetes bacterium]|nr:tryptophan synthase subunit alpha [Armatimonadota bacterium]
MISLEDRFSQLSALGEKALIPFVTAGDPPLDQLPSILSALCEGGADAIEIGLPFSDPIADGPAIQASSQRALDRGVTPRDVLATISSWSNPGIPLILMGYYNPVLKMTHERFAKSAREAEVSGVIISDLTPEESDAWIQAALAEGLEPIFLTAPTSTDARLDAVVARGKGFIYAISRTGVTGHGSEVPPESRDLVQRIKSRTQLPVCVGFGISQPDHVRMVCQLADGAVVGSVLVNLLAEKWDSGGGRDEVISLIRGLKDATRA